MATEWNEKEWRKYGGKGFASSLRWLTNGCERCGSKTWQVTNDGWAYCDSCHMGVPTEIWTNLSLAQLNEDGSITQIDCGEED